MGRSQEAILDELDDEPIESFLKRHPLVQRVEFNPSASSAGVFMPDDVLTASMKKAMQRSGGAILGRFVIDHEPAGWDRHTQQLAFCITELSVSEGRGFATIKFLENERGQMLKLLLESGYQPAWSMEGTLSSRDGVVRDVNFHCLTAFVANHPGAPRRPAPSRAEYERRMALCQGCAVGS